MHNQKLLLDNFESSIEKIRWKNNNWIYNLA